MVKARRYDIDWIRVIVFDILIIYHVGMFFVEWNWHIKNNEIISWIAYPMRFINQWRIPILFVVSGMGTRFALSHRTGKKYISERISRLFIPLLFGILFIIPPQVYLERLVSGATTDSYFLFYPQFFNGIYPQGNLSWHHLWFLPYLLIMSLLATPLFLQLRKEDNAFILFLKRIFNKYPISLYLFIIPILIIELSLCQYPITHALVGDWYAISLYSTLFIFGFLLVSTDNSFWDNVEKIKKLSLVIGIIGFSFLLWRGFDKDHLSIIISSINMWAWILAIFGYAAKFLNKKSELVQRRNKAVYPFYILHQTITIIFGYYLMDLEIHYLYKMLMMISGTFFISWFIYRFIILKIKFIQSFFGIKS